MGIEDFREKIDRIDKEVLALLNKRMQFAGKIGEAKRAEGGPVYVPAREETLVQKLLQANKGPMGEIQVRSIFREIISAGISLQRKMLIGFLGPEATAAHQAAIKNFGSSLDYKAYDTIADVFDEVERREIDFGVVPVEHSIEGTMFETLDQLSAGSLKVVSQIILPVEHCLISKHTLKESQCVYSTDTILRECREWLRDYLPQAELITTRSTGQAVARAQKEAGAAAIGSRLAAHVFEMPIVACGIQDNKETKIRYVIVGHDYPLPSADVSWKSSFYLTLPNTPGALQKTLLPLASRGIDLTKIETRPSHQRTWDYVFYVDLLGHREDPIVAEAIQELEAGGAFVKWLGSYPRIKGAE